MISRSFSTSSSLMRSFSSSVDLTCTSSLTACSSRSLSEFAKSASSVKLFPSSVAYLLWLRPMRSLSFAMSVCMLAMDAFSSDTSFSCTRTCPSTRTLFWVSTAVCALISATRSDCCDASLESFTSSVWVPIHMRCRSLHTRLFWSISFLKLLIVASRGPTTAASAPAWASNFWRRASYLRLRESRSRIFFSISSLRRRISSSYLSTNCSLRLSSSSMSLTVTLSWSLCAVVLSASTLIRDSSFRTCATWFSLECIWACIDCVCLSVLWAAFWRVVWSASDDRICASIPWVSLAVAASTFSTLVVSSSTIFFSWSTLPSSASDCSSERLSITYCSCMRCRSCRTWSSCFSRYAADDLTLLKIAETASLRSCSFRMLCLKEEISPCMVCSSCCTSRSAFSTLWRCSSRRLTARSALFHWRRSSFLRWRILSISSCASFSTCWAARVSSCWESCWVLRRSSRS
mmetsp:Transcript_59333/g.139767  ORF Transcript_59333/g.139767 Transcript_59333/m.139767 type:complete len:461 (+) Transcript_59333:759-2141(+)